METGRLIKSKRIAKGLTMKEVANFVGVSEASVSKWESGKIDNIRSDKLMKLAEILDIPVIDLVLDAEEREAREAQRKKDQKETEDLRDMLKDNPKLRMLLSASSKLSESDIDQLYRIASLMGKE